MHPLLQTSHLFKLAGALNANDHPSNSEIWGVTLVGLGTVIAALAILVVVILLFGKIFDSINEKQKAKEAAAKAKQKPKPSAPAKKTPAPAPAKPAPEKKPAVPAVQTVSEDDEVIAVISAVVAMMSEQDGKTYKIKSVAKSQRTNGFSSRSAWAMDGRRQNVNPF